MKGNVKVIEVSTDNFILKPKRTYKNVILHFRDYNNHTLKLSNGKEVIVNIQGLSVEAKSLLLEADAWLENDTEEPVPTIVELRFYPEIERVPSNKTD